MNEFIINGLWILYLYGPYKVPGPNYLKTISLFIIYKILNDRCVQEVPYVKE